MMVELPPDVAAAITSRVDDPDLQELAAESVGTIRMVIDKVLANQVDNTTFELPADPNSLERRILPRVQRLSAASKTALGTAAKARLRPGAEPAAVEARTRIYGVAGALDPTQGTALVPAASALALPETLAPVVDRVGRRLQQQMEAAIAPDPNVPGAPDPDPNSGVGGDPGPIPTFVPTKLRLNFRNVTPRWRVAEPGELFEGTAHAFTHLIPRRSA